jgi:hypothetical protein
MKISSIVTLGTCLIFLSDLRLSNPETTLEIERTLSCNKIRNYRFFHNSSKNKRGVGILIDCSYNINVLHSYRDPEENILGLKLDLDGFVFWAVSIYGPNTNDFTFFVNLKNLILSQSTGTGTVPFIIGGDWNATLSTLNSPDNIDIINPLTQSVRIRTVFYVTLKARNSVIFRDNQFLFFPLKEDANDYLSRKLQLANSFYGRTTADLLRV